MIGGCKVIYEEGLPNYEETGKYFIIYEEAVSHIRLAPDPSEFPDIQYEESFIFFFIGARSSRFGRSILQPREV